jgi:hypothetical protein
MINFQNDRRIKLSNYKLANITSEKGEWRNLLYDHILPIDQREKNIISAIREDFWSYYKIVNIKLHQYFHHLNSSQALCFNLFFPLFYYDKNLLNYVLNNLMEIKNGNILKCEFEKILDSKEFTNIDFYIEHSNNKRTLFEIKYTERKFATVAGGKGHSNKYEKIYKPRLEKILKPEFINQDFVFNNYQVVRNLSYIDEKTTVVFLFPKANLDLQDTEKLISKIILHKYVNQVKIIYLENFTSQILHSDYLKTIHPIFETLEHIYVN